MRVPLTVRLWTQAPRLQERPAPQLVPSGTLAPVSVQAGPLAQDVVPTWHAFAGVQTWPGVHATQAPPLQTSGRDAFTSHVVPSASAAPSTQVEVPVAQSVVPAWHGVGLPAQARPAVHAAQAPALHTRFVPQLVPSARRVVVSTQAWVPVAQEVVPATHAFGLVEQEAP